MLIKNLQKFRQEWKEREGYNHPNWDENFIGSIHDQTSGFYKMVNGIVGNIRADLTPKLQNAQDEQAVYEFLQNAADSQSTDCAIIYDEKYLMILNNGKPFSNKDLHAILNTFQGTKADKGLPENCEKIGRYGVGFKLAYRLLGKSDGVNELLDKLAGPILFSWNKMDQFRKFVNLKPSDKLDLHDDISDGAEAPWLMKIVLACFPAMLGETVKDLDYNDQVAFKPEELSKLTQFLAKHQSLIKHLILSKGSLFFLEFGPKKHHKLQESLINLKSGIGYSLNTLKSLSRVVLQDELIEKYPIEFERFSIPAGTKAFKKIDPEFPNCPIEIAVGIPQDLEQARQLKTAPNLYQFFPMRNERHNLAFFIHGTSFAKITDRTRLDNQGEANKETLLFLTTSLKKQLNSYQKKDFERFVNIYRAILFSGAPDKYNSELINEYLYSPLLEYIRNNIPTHGKKIFTKDQVILKQTSLDVEPLTLGIGKEWFYWTDGESSEELQREAASNAKLGLKRWGIKELIEQGEPALINKWIGDLEEDSYKVLVEELKIDEADEAFKARFQTIKIFKFGDSEGEVQYYSLDELSKDDGLFLLNEKTSPVKEVLKNLGFSVLEFNLEAYAPIFQLAKDKLDYLSDERKVFQKIAAKIPESDLTPEQKQSLLNALSKLEGVSEDELRGLELFTNQAGQVVSLFELIANDLDTESWLEPFKVNRDEHSERLKSLSINQKQSNIYSKIILPYWADILPFIDHLEAPSFYESTIAYYKIKPRQPGLQDKNYLYVDREFRFQEAENVFYHPSLEETDEETFETLKDAFQVLMDLQFPDPRILPFLKSAPFLSQPTTKTKAWPKHFEALLASGKLEHLPFQSRKTLFLFFQNVLAPKDLLKLNMFSNQQGTFAPLASMLFKNSELPKWLEAYCIDDKEYFEELGEGLLNESQIFDSLILPYWDKLIEQDTVKQDVEAFYKQCLHYFELGRKGQSFNSQAYVYVDEILEFQPANQVYFHKAMLEIENLEVLADAVLALTEKPVPANFLLPLCTQKPFIIRDQSFLKMIKTEEVVLDLEAVMALQNLLEQTREDLFSAVYIEESGVPGKYKVCKREGNIPYYAPDSNAQLHAAVAEFLGEKYKPLPQELYRSELKNKGLLTADAVYQRLTRVSSPEQLSAIAAEGGNVQAQQQLLNRLSKIVLVEGASYDAQALEFQMLEMIQQEGVNVENLRGKVFLQDAEGEEWPLKAIGCLPKIKIKSGKQKAFELKIKDILPSLASIGELPKKIAKQFDDFPDNKALVSFLYKGREKPTKEIFAALQKNHRTLENTAQLAFVLLYAQANNLSQQLRYFSVHSASGTTMLSEFDHFHLTPAPFINERAVLSETHYPDLEEALRLNEENPKFIFGNKTLVRSSYIGGEEHEFVLTPLKTASETESTDALRATTLGYVYQIWERQSLDGLNLVTPQADGTLYGFTPGKYVFPAKYALEYEAVPETLRSSLPEKATDDQQAAFYSAIGIHGPESRLVAVRAFLAGDEGLDLDTARQYLNELPQTLVTQTLDWVHLQKFTFSDKADSFQLLISLYNRVGKLGANQPLPLIQKATSKQTTYTLREADTKRQLYSLGEHVQKELTETYRYPLAKLLENLKAKEGQLINIPIQGVKAQPIDVRLELDSEKLEEHAQEWDASHYLDWKESHDWEIFLTEGEMPHQVMVQGEAVASHQTGNNLVLEKRIYLNKNLGNLEDALLELASPKGLKEKHLLELLRLKNQVASPAIAVPSGRNGSKGLFIQQPDLDVVKQHLTEGDKCKLHLEVDPSQLSEELLAQLMELSAATELQVEEG